jgi:la-related protein 4
MSALQKQIEFYFSRENLNKDQYLVSQMDSQMYVPVITIQQVGESLLPLLASRHLCSNYSTPTPISVCKGATVDG